MHLGAALHPSNGTLVANMHCGDRPNLGAVLLRVLRGQPPQLIDEEAPDGREVLRVARLFRRADFCICTWTALGMAAFGCGGGSEKAQCDAAGRHWMATHMCAQRTSSATLLWL